MNISLLMLLKTELWSLSENVLNLLILVFVATVNCVFFYDWSLLFISKIRNKNMTGRPFCNAVGLDNNNIVKNDSRRVASS